MLATNTVRATVHSQIRTLLEESGHARSELSGDEGLTDLGLTSLLLARLIVQLEAELGVDPFAEDGMVFDARTVDAVVAVYEQACAPAAPGGDNHA
ncbi:MAG: acyl carrier protein [Kineosporiaceae bacterium]